MILHQVLMGLYQLFPQGILLWKAHQTSFPRTAPIVQLMKLNSQHKCYVYLMFFHLREFIILVLSTSLWDYFHQKHPSICGTMQENPLKCIFCTFHYILLRLLLFLCSKLFEWNYQTLENLNFLQEFYHSYISLGAQ